MRIQPRIAVLSFVIFLVFAHCSWARAEDDAKRVRKAIEHSTLDQPGTKPFHLKADIAPSFPRDKASGRTGAVEIWWRSPKEWRREVRSPEFHQIEIVNGSKDWQKNEGSYFPEWLREVAVELTDPVPDIDATLAHVKGAEVRKLMGSTYYSWTLPSSDGHVQKTIGAGISITDATGSLFYGDGANWGGLFKDFKDFHGRSIARIVTSGSPEVTARISVLEDLGEVPSDYFDSSRPGEDSQPIHTQVVDEIEMRKNLLPGEPIAWPPLKDGPLEGILTAKVVVDRDGLVKEVGNPVSDNPGVNDAALMWIKDLRFKPHLQNGAAVQVVTRITMPFKTLRPAGGETFESAKTYFERGRSLGFHAFAKGATPYVVRAEFPAKASSGSVETGRYEDTWVNETHWRREGWFGNGHLVRSRNGDKAYFLEEGSDAKVLQLVFRMMEPIPSMDTFVESDWRMKSEDVGGDKTVRVVSGYESPDGVLDDAHGRGYWFDATGSLVKTFFNGLVTRRSEFQDFEGIRVARQIDVLSKGLMATRIRVTEIVPASALPTSTFVLKGHEWKRSFTDEER